MHAIAALNHIAIIASIRSIIRGYSHALTESEGNKSNQRDATNNCEE